MTTAKNATAAGISGGATRAQTSTTNRPQYTPSPTHLSVAERARLLARVRRFGVHVVSEDEGEWVHRTVRVNAHQLRQPPAWCLDVDQYAAAQALGIVGVALLDDLGDRWRATLDDFAQYGLTIDRGAGVQRALPLARWSKNGAPPATNIASRTQAAPDAQRVPPDAPRQGRLFDLLVGGR